MDCSLSVEPRTLFFLLAEHYTELFNDGSMNCSLSGTPRMFFVVLIEWYQTVCIESVVGAYQVLLLRIYIQIHQAIRSIHTSKQHTQITNFIITLKKILKFDWLTTAS